MNIGSGMNTVSSLYGQQKGNHMKAPVSAEKTFYTAETPKVYRKRSIGGTLVDLPIFLDN